MQEIDSRGIFWLPGHEEDALSGHLTFSPTEKIDLVLIGTFANRSDESDGPSRIVGWIGSKQVTLDGCFSLGIYRRYPGVSESHFRANRAFIGQILENEEFEFRQVYFELSHLNDWMQHTGLKIEQSASDVNSFSVSYSHPPEEVTSFSRGTITLGQRWSRNHPRDQLEVDVQRFLKIDYEDSMNYRDILSDVGRIQDLLTLCLDRPIYTDKIKFRRPITANDPDAESSDVTSEVEFIAPRLRYEPKKKRKWVHANEMLLTYSELGGIQVIAKWLEEVERFTRPLNSLMSIRNTDKMYTENRFLNVASAAEAFHRSIIGGTYMEPDEFNQLFAKYLENTPDTHREWLESRLSYGNDAPLPKRLRQLAQQSRPATRDVIGQEGRWASTVSAVRNELTHLGDGPTPFNGSDLYYLSESIFSVLRVCMLNICGISTQTWESKRQSQAISKHIDQTREAVDNIRRELGLSRSKN